MKNYVQPGRTLTFTAAAALASGAGVLLGAATFGVNSYDVAIGESGEATLEGVYTLPKAAVSSSAFEAAYWDDTNKVVTNVATSNVKIGFFTETTAASVSTAVRLIPSA